MPPPAGTFVIAGKVVFGVAADPVCERLGVKFPGPTRHGPPKGLRPRCSPLLIREPVISGTIGTHTLCQERTLSVI